MKAPKSWTKEEEAAWLDRAIAALGPQSYLGPWLTENRDSIVSGILSDTLAYVEPPRVAYTRAVTLIEEAKAEAVAIIRRASDQADRELAVTRGRIEVELSRGRRELEAAAGRL